MSAGGVVVPRAAATVVLLRPGPDGPEVLMSHRPATMAFGPGIHVFPGGAVDAADADPRLLARSVLAPAACARALVGELRADEAAAHHVAAIRELFEEAGVLLADGAGAVPADELAAARHGRVPFAELAERFALRLRTDALVALSRWVTPPVMDRRFDTRFFVASLPAGGAESLVGDEVAAHEWLTPLAALDAMAAGRIELWPPTAATLQQLLEVRDADDVRARLAPMAPAGPPEVEPVARGVVRVRLRGAGGVPGQAVNAYVLGERRLVLVDPGDPNDAAADALLGVASAAGGEIVAVALTQPVPDHAGGAEGLGYRLGVPVLASAGARRWLPGELGTLEDGARLEAGDVPLRVHAAPGPHPDHLAFEVVDRGIVLAGDLVGPGPSRAIPSGADAAALEASRERVLRLGAGLVLGGHEPTVGAGR